MNIIYIPGTPMTSSFEGEPVNPPKQGRTSNQNKGPHLGSRYRYIQTIWCYWLSSRDSQSEFTKENPKQKQINPAILWKRRGLRGEPGSLQFLVPGPLASPGWVRLHQVGRWCSFSMGWFFRFHVNLPGCNLIENCVTVKNWKVGWMKGWYFFLRLFNL